jgi:hypothetical protein
MELAVMLEGASMDAPMAALAERDEVGVIINPALSPWQ